MLLQKPSPSAAGTQRRGYLARLTVISTLGGLSIFGFNGFVIGPLIAAMFITVWGIFSVSRSETRTRES